MKRIPRDKACQLELNKDLSPALIVKQNEEFIVETEDALGGKVRSQDDLPIESTFGPMSKTTPPSANPVAGPIYVEDVEPGDILVVDILDIIPDSQGATCITPGVGPLSDSYNWPMGRGPYTHIIKHEPGKSGTTSDGKGILTPNVTWDLHPFIGTIATAPEREVRATLTSQGPWGGNMDVRDICKGNRIYFPSYNSGGLLFLGDVHGSQADTEFTGSADETRSEVKMKCSVIREKKIPFVRIEKPNSIIQLNSYRPLEDTLKQAILWMMSWLVGEYGVESRETYLHMTVNPDVRMNIYQMVAIADLNYTVGVEFPKKYLPGR